MKYNKINEMADLVSSGMNDIMNSDEHQSMFGGPSFVKEASKKEDAAKKEKEDAKKAKDKAKAKAEADKCKTDKCKKDMKKPFPPKGKKATDLLESLISIADLLGDNNMLISEAIADKLVQAIIIEARRETRLSKKAEALGLPTKELDPSEDISFEEESDEPKGLLEEDFPIEETETLEPDSRNEMVDAKEALADLAIDLKAGLREATEDPSNINLEAFKELIKMEIDSISSENSISPLKAFENVLNIDTIIESLTGILEMYETSSIEEALEDFESNSDKFMRLEPEDMDASTSEEEFEEPVSEFEEPTAELELPEKMHGAPEGLANLFD